MPSKAAYALGKQIREKYIAANPAEYREEINQDIAGMCQSALVDLLEKAQRANLLLRLCPPTVRQVIEAGDKAISAAGLNPWCMNEGLATGDETIDFDLAAELEPWKPENQTNDSQK